jgi:hypothetical protein
MIPFRLFPTKHLSTCKALNYSCKPTVYRHFRATQVYRPVQSNEGESL